jgi:hypothetical protein
VATIAWPLNHKECLKEDGKPPERLLGRVTLIWRIGLFGVLFQTFFAPVTVG